MNTILLGVLLAFQGQQAQPPALDVIERSFSAMGGMKKLSSLRSLESKIVGHVYALEQSERPEGPWFVTYVNGVENLDFETASARFKSRSSGVMFPEPQDFTVEYGFADPQKPTRKGGSFGFSAQDARRQLALCPERVLFTALASRDLALEAPTIFHEVKHDVLKFHWGNLPVTLLINHQTHLPSAVESLEPGDGYWSIWGDVRYRTVWGNWDIAPKGIMLPTLWDYERNGIRQEEYWLANWKLGWGEPKSSQAVSNQLSGAVPSVGGAKRPIPFRVIEVAPGVVQYLSSFNCAAIEQEDGVVLLEAVVSGEYAQAILNDVHKRFPGKPIKAVISSDDAWPHIGGLRQLVSLGIPIYSVRPNREILNRLFKAPSKLIPDELEKHPRSAHIVYVDKKCVLGKGKNTLEIYPMLGSVCERMLYGYLPHSKLLYAPDVIQHLGDQWFNVNLIGELVRAVDRDGVAPESAFAFHSEPIAYSKLEDVLAKERAKE